MKAHILAYLNRQRVLARGANTLELYAHYLNHHKEWLRRKGIEDAAKVRLSHLERYARELLSRYSNNSTLARLLLVGRFYRHLHKTGTIPGNPALGLHPPSRTQPLVPTPPTREDVDKIISILNTKTPIGQRNRAMLELLFSTGLRLGEFLNLEVGDLRFKDGTLLVRMGKGGKDRVALLSKKAHEALMLYIEEARPLLAAGLAGHEAWREHGRRNGRSPQKALWLAAHGGVLSRHSLGCQFRLWADKLGRPFYPHALRHAFAVHMLRKGADIRHVQALLGHESIDTTKMYLRLVVDDYRKAYDRAFPRIKLPKSGPGKGTG